MENRDTKTITYPNIGIELTEFERKTDSYEKASEISIPNNKYLYVSDIYQEEQFDRDASLIKNPLFTEFAFAQFGLMLGAIPPMAIFGKFLVQHLRTSDELWLIPLLSFVNFVCAMTGYFSGKIVGRIIADVERWRWANMLILLPFIGIGWGILTGAAGGIFIFGIGAFFGAIIAAAVGGFALPILTIFHRILKTGDLIEREKFLPIAVGITVAISALFLGL